MQDTGCGVAPDVLARLFAAFEQADSSMTRQHGGTGLGVAIVRQLARLMGGEAGATSTPGAGSTFWLTARLQKVLNRDDAVLRQQGSVEAALSRAHAEARLLLVDDDPVNREIALAMLHSVIAHVDVAEDGQAAIDLFRQQTHALILMDMQMPGIGGPEAKRQIRRLPGGAATVIVALTADVFAEERAACFDTGMDDFLAKPFTAAALFDTVLEGLSRPR